MQADSLEEFNFRMELEGWLKSLTKRQKVSFAIAFALHGPYVTDEFREWAVDWEAQKDGVIPRAHKIWNKSKMEIEAATESACCSANGDYTYSYNAAFNAAWYRRFDTNVHYVYHQFLVYLESNSMSILDIVTPQAFIPTQQQVLEYLNTVQVAPFYEAIAGK